MAIGVLTKRLREAPATAAVPIAASAPEHATALRLIVMAVVLLAAHVYVFGFYADVAKISDFYPLADRANPYWTPDYAGLLYLRGTLIVLSACLMLLAPGLVLALAFGYATSVARWILYAFPFTLVLVSAAAAAAQLTVGHSLVDTTFVIVVALCCVPGLVLVSVRILAGSPMCWPQHALRDAALMLAMPALLLIGLTPKFYWQSFNGDGAHALESARLLLHQPLPFWDPAAGAIAAFPGVTSMLFAFPASWFIRLFGDVEASARLPYLMYVVVAVAGLTTVILHGRSSRVPLSVHLLLWAAIVVYTVAVAYSATYSPYTADIALPATQDTLLVACFLGFVAAWLERRLFPAALFGLLTYLSLPNGFLLLGLWMVAVVLVMRPVPWRMVLFSGGLVVACMVLAAAVPVLLHSFDVPAPGREYAFGGLLDRITDVKLTDWKRFAFAAVPTGILPVVSLLLWRRQDEVSRAITLVTAALFAFFYIQAGTALHYYIPMMLLPLVVYWRMQPVPGARPVVFTALTSVALATSLWLSLPASGAIDSSSRVVGSTFESRVTGYASMQPAAFASAAVMHFAFPYDWSRAVPDSTYGGSPIVWNYYARHSSNLLKNYIAQRATEAAPLGARLLGAKNGWALYVRSDSLWQAQRKIRPKAAPGAALYSIPREEKFR